MFTSHTCRLNYCFVVALSAAVLSASPGIAQVTVQNNVLHYRPVQPQLGWPAHYFFTSASAAFPVFHILEDGRMGFGQVTPNGEWWRARAKFNFGYGYNSVSIDEVGTSRVANSISVSGITNGAGCIGFNAARQADGDFFFNTSGTENGGALIWADTKGSLHFSTRRSGSNNAGIGTSAQDRWLPASWAADDRRLTIGPTGQVKIGRGQALSTAHADYQLAVDGKLVARAVHVTLANWADFVFEPGHTMLSLPALKQYVQAHRHLPAIPSAADVTRDGVSLGDMDARLLQTLEKLTLHVIALNERNEQLQAQLTRLAAQLPPVPAVPEPAGR